MIFKRIICKMLICLVLTVVIEAFFAFAFGVRSRYGQLVVLLTNLITNPLLNSILTVVSFYLSPSFYFPFLILLEITVVITEGAVFKKALSVKMNPFLFSFLINACSYFIGTGILKLF